MVSIINTLEHIYINFSIVHKKINISNFSSYVSKYLAVLKANRIV